MPTKTWQQCCDAFSRLGLHIDCTAQVRVAYALVPHQSTQVQSLLSRLEKRLALAASTRDKRAVFMLVDTYSPPANLKA
jgi:hypothetical protein